MEWRGVSWDEVVCARGRLEGCRSGPSSPHEYARTGTLDARSGGQDSEASQESGGRKEGEIGMLVGGERGAGYGGTEACSES